MIGPMHHSSRTVSDIERSIAFYRDILGFEVVEDISSDEEGIQYASTTPESQLRIVMLQAGGAVVELIQFLKQEGKSYDNPPALNDVGSSHIAFEPEEVDYVPFLARKLGDAGLIFGTDYSHPDSISPRSVQKILDYPELSDDVKRKVLSDNPARFWGIQSNGA